MSPTAGRDYPRSYAQLRGWFDEDGKCLDYLDWLRWPDGFVAPAVAATTAGGHRICVGAAPAVTGASR